MCSGRPRDGGVGLGPREEVLREPPGVATAVSAGEGGAASGTDRGVPGVACRPGPACRVPQDSAAETAGFGRGSLVLKASPP